MSLSRLIRSCAETKSILNGRAAHACVIVSGAHQDVQTSNHLLAMYTKLDHIDYAQKLFDRMPVRNLVTWTSLISAYSKLGLTEKALYLFRSLVLDQEISPNEYTYVAAISACAQANALRSGKEIHGRIYRTGISLNSFVCNCLVNFYGKCKLSRSARLVFETMAEPDTVSCVSLVTGYVQCGEYEEGLRIFTRYSRLGVEVNEFLYGSILGCCAALENLKAGRQMQCIGIKRGVRMDQFASTSLINFYAKCGQVELAGKALRESDRPNVTAWTALIGGCVQVGKCRVAIGLYTEMLSSGLKPSEQTFASVLGAFGREEEVQGGVQLYCLIKKGGFDSFTFVSNAVLDFYARVGFLDECFMIFDEMGSRDVVSWNSLIAGCVGFGHHKTAAICVQNMVLDGFDPDIYTYSCLLRVCGDLPAAEWGRQTHCRIVKPGMDFNVVVGSALVDMYAKCGRMGDARKIFDILPNKNMITWNTMISGYARHGFGKEALDIYDIMLKNGVKPNDGTFIGVLSSCGHVGAMEEALHHFRSMTSDFGIFPRTDHIACIVSLFARKGQMRAAYDFVRSLPGEPSKVVWRCLLYGCVENRDLNLGVYVAEKIISTDPNDTSARVLLSNIYAGSDMWKEASRVREITKGMKKETGYSWT
ncbi:Pentatricopeptide repeat-containing protein [Striga hermonthica]|uniref:Pentatricopeptide repeat-containing protein n=1 Tax=Striga hermonthica TaxID=68872 RepID=A0A9N7NEQ5_STRHE|nr:Pentatricopeptide repeat-containing protein [Striga hermonthica]